MAKNNYILYGGIVVGIALITIGIFAIRKRKRVSKIIFIGGLDNRQGDLNLDEQVQLIKKGLGRNLDIIGIRYNEFDKAEKSIKNEDKSPYTIMFSAGCQWASKVADLYKQKGFNLKNIYILEPYHKGGTATKSVQSAVNMGVPSKNVFVGTSSSTGKGIVDNATPTPNCSPKHWCSVTEVAKLLV